MHDGHLYHSADGPRGVTVSAGSKDDGDVSMKQEETASYPGRELGAGGPPLRNCICLHSGREAFVLGMRLQITPHDVTTPVWDVNEYLLFGNDWSNCNINQTQSGRE